MELGALDHQEIEATTIRIHVIDKTWVSMPLSDFPHSGGKFDCHFFFRKLYDVIGIQEASKKPYLVAKILVRNTDIVGDAHHRHLVDGSEVHLREMLAGITMAIEGFRLKTARSAFVTVDEGLSRKVVRNQEWTEQVVIRIGLNMDK